jgi:hypothetical protein
MQTMIIKGRNATGKMKTHSKRRRRGKERAGMGQGEVVV